MKTGFWFGLLSATAFIAVSYLYPGLGLTGAARGRAEAKRDIAAGKLGIRMYGMYPEWDPQLRALLQSRFGADLTYVLGCVVKSDEDREILERARGYNEEMEREIERRFGVGALDNVRKEAIRQWQRDEGFFKDETN